ncbi:MAG: sigma-70 family RNA polymerase sigma factor [Solirubrobacterales bacterium]
MDGAAIKKEKSAGGLRLRLLSERALGDRVVSGDRGAFAELFRRYQQPLYGYCVSILGNQEDSADALQNTMAKALKALPGEERNLQLKPWLFQVARNECIDLIRSRRTTDDISEEDPVAKHGVEAEVAGRERLRELLSDLDNLPEKQRSALVMRELNGLTFDEIGVAFGASPNAAKQVVYEARVSLMELAEGRTMECDPVREAISARDGRVLRGRRIRAHLRTCDSCQDFKRGIETRSREFRSLIPAIPAAAVAAIVEMINGPGGGAAGLVGLAGVKAALGGTAAKTVAVVAVTASVGAGTVGVIERNRQKDGANETSRSATEAVGSTSSDDAFDISSASENGIGGSARDGTPRGSEKSEKRGSSEDPSNPGKSETSPGHNKGPDGNAGQGSSDGGSPGNSASNGGGSGGSKGLGAVPTHGGKPAQLPDAAAQGQQQAEDAQSQGGPPASPGNSANAPGAANAPTPPAKGNGSGK